MDNDALLAAIVDGLTSAIPTAACARFWDVYERTRVEGSVPDVARSIRVLRGEFGDETARAAMKAVDAVDPSRFPYPRALEVIAHLRSLGVVLILSDGELAYQKRKIARAGLTSGVDDVLVFPNKLDHLSDVINDHPADQFVFVDDKAQILAGIRRRVPSAFLIQVRQGKYGSRPSDDVDLAIDTIAELESLRTRDLYEVRR